MRNIFVTEFPEKISGKLNCSFLCSSGAKNLRDKSDKMSNVNVTTLSTHLALFSTLINLPYMARVF